MTIHCKVLEKSSSTTNAFLFAYIYVRNRFLLLKAIIVRVIKEKNIITSIGMILVY